MNLMRCQECGARASLLSFDIAQDFETDRTRIRVSFKCENLLCEADAVISFEVETESVNIISTNKKGESSDVPIHNPEKG